MSDASEPHDPADELPPEPDYGTDAAAAGDAAPTPAPAGTSMGLDANIASLLAYAFGWISGLVIYLIERDNREVRFHAAQSILVGIVVTILWIANTILGLIPVIGLISVVVGFILGLGGFALWIFLMIQGYNLNHYKLPVLGDMAEDWAGRQV